MAESHLPEWARAIEENILRRAVLWQSLNGLPKPEIRKDDLPVAQLLVALDRAMAGLEAVTSSASLAEAQAVAEGVLEAIRGMAPGNMKQTQTL